MSTGRIWKSSFSSLPGMTLSKARGKKVISFDLFDTVIRRRVEPEVIKDIVARELASLLAESGVSCDWRALRTLRRDIEQRLARRNQEAGLDDEFDYSSMTRMWIAGAINHYSAPPLADSVARRLCDQIFLTEKKIEMCAQEACPRVAETLQALRKEGYRIVFLSDFYFTPDVLEEFLENLGLASYFDAGYSSASHFLRKASGRLFHLLLKSEEISPKDLLHIGDNPHADVFQGTSHGIDVIHISDRRERRRRLLLQAAEVNAERNPFWRGALVEQSIRSLPRRIESERMHLPKRERDAYLLGSAIAPLYVHFVEHLLHEARRNKVDAIYFCAREGYLFRRIASRLSNDIPLEYISVSRQSTFLPSLEHLSLSSISPLTQQYPSLSLNQVMHNLSMKQDEYGSIAAEYGFSNCDSLIENYAELPAFQGFISDFRIQSRFHAAQSSARTLFLDYLKQKRFFARKKIFLVDIGWKGSIIDNIFRICKDHPGCPEIECHLMGLQPGAPRTEVTKSGYFFHREDSDILERSPLMNVGLLECYATAPHSSARGYARMPSGWVKPILNKQNVEGENWLKQIRPAQRGIFDYLHDYRACRPLFACWFDESPREWLPYYQEHARRLISFPRKHEVDAFIRVSHVENFGLHSVRRFSKEKLRAAPVHTSNWFIKQYLKFRFSFWPAAQLRRHGLSLFRPLYDSFDIWFRTHRF